MSDCDIEVLLKLYITLNAAGEMMVGSKQVFFMDEISTGLDSSTTYAIVKFLRDQTHALNYTTMISLLQPAPESYDLFDDILLLAEGGTSLPWLCFSCLFCIISCTVFCP